MGVYGGGMGGGGMGRYKRGKPFSNQIRCGVRNHSATKSDAACETIRQHPPLAATEGAIFDPIRFPFSSQSHPILIPFSSHSHPIRIPIASQSHPIRIPFASQSHPNLIPIASQSHPNLIPILSHTIASQSHRNLAGRTPEHPTLQRHHHIHHWPAHSSCCGQRFRNPR